MRIEAISSIADQHKHINMLNAKVKWIVLAPGVRGRAAVPPTTAQGILRLSKCPRDFWVLWKEQDQGLGGEKQQRHTLLPNGEQINFLTPVESCFGILSRAWSGGVKWQTLQLTASIRSTGGINLWPRFWTGWRTTGVRGWIECEQAMVFFGNEPFFHHEVCGDLLEGYYYGGGMLLCTITNGISKILAEHLLIFNTPPCWLPFFSSTFVNYLSSPMSLATADAALPHAYLGQGQGILLLPATCSKNKHKNPCNNNNWTESYHGISLPGIQAEMPNDHAAP